jgi:hypothetical protein
MNGQLHIPPALPTGKEPVILIDKRLGGTQSWHGRGVEEKNSHPLPGLEIHIIQPVAQGTSTFQWHYVRTNSRFEVLTAVKIQPEFWVGAHPAS